MADGTSYDAQYSPLSAEFYQITKPIDGDYADVPYYLHSLRKTKGRVLEMGAGTGRLLIPLLRAGISIEALEPSPYMCDWLEKNLKREKLKCLIHKQTAEDFVERESFAAILASFGSFQLLNPYPVALKALRNFFENLKPGGRLFVDIDVIRPEPHRANQWTHGVTLKTGPKSQIVLGGSRNWDFVEQLENVHLRYEKWDSGKLVQSELQDFSLRSYGRWEFEYMLREAGFDKIQFCMDYEPGHVEDLHPEVLTICFVAQK